MGPGKLAYPQPRNTARARGGGTTDGIAVVCHITRLPLGREVFRQSLVGSSNTRRNPEEMGCRLAHRVSLRVVHPFGFGRARKRCLDDPPCVLVLRLDKRLQCICGWREHVSVYNGPSAALLSQSSHFPTFSIFQSVQLGHGNPHKRVLAADILHRPTVLPDHGASHQSPGSHRRRDNLCEHDNNLGTQDG